MNILKGQHWVVIPSRANSQRFPGKALAIIGYVSLVERAISLGLSVKDIGRIIVTTNDNKVEKISSFYNKVQIHKRPDEYAQSNTRIDDTLINMVKTLDECGEFLHLVQLTSPFTQSIHLKNGIGLLNKFPEIDSVQLVTEIPNAYHAFSQRIIDNGRIKFKYPEDREKYYNYQSKPPHYAFAGYVGFKTESLLKYSNIWGNQSIGIIAPSECSIDIDTPEDLEYAEFVMKRQEDRYATTKRNTSPSKDNQYRKENTISV